jgi:hypothetical protein
MAAPLQVGQKTRPVIDVATTLPASSCWLTVKILALMNRRMIEPKMDKQSQNPQRFGVPQGCREPSDRGLPQSGKPGKKPACHSAVAIARVGWCATRGSTHRTTLACGIRPFQAGFWRNKT